MQVQTAIESVALGGGMNWLICHSHLHISKQSGISQQQLGRFEELHGFHLLVGHPPRQLNMTAAVY